MANNNIEIELKFPLHNADEVKTFLQAKAKLISENIYQKDTYYSPVYRDFLKPEYPFEWLRIRESSKGIWINYKHFYPENVKITDYCDELETKVENGETIKSIFKTLDLKEIVVVEKPRSTWVFEDVEIVLDQVTDLGSYIELEATKPFEDPKKGKEYLYEILKKLNANVGEEEYKGYPFLMIQYGTNTSI